MEFDIFERDYWFTQLLKFSENKNISNDRLIEVAIDRVIAYSGADGPDGSYSCSNIVLIKKKLIRKVQLITPHKIRGLDDGPAELY